MLITHTTKFHGPPNHYSRGSNSEKSESGPSALSDPTDSVTFSGGGDEGMVLGGLLLMGASIPVGIALHDVAAGCVVGAIGLAALAITAATK